MRAAVGFVLALWLPMAAWAQSYPDYVEVYVNDFADVLSDTQKDSVRAKLRAVSSEHGVEFTVVTIRSMLDHGHSGEIEPFATGLFNYWGVGDADRNDGVMLLVAVKDRRVRIEVGSGYARTKNRPMARIIDDVILPEFRAGNLPAGILSGVDAIIKEVSAPPLTMADRARGWANGLWSFLKSTIQFLIWPITAGVGGLGYYLLRRYQRYKPRVCPIDRTDMQLLAEEWDDQHLKPGQLTEENLKSVDYDVWICPECEHLTIEAYKSWMSRYEACGECGFKTLEGESTTLESATTSSTGLKRIDYSCQFCNNAYSVEKVIPKISKSSSSSSSGGFGGGSSSGGGASGSW